jgi:hypothetical protein
LSMVMSAKATTLSVSIGTIFTRVIRIRKLVARRLQNQRSAFGKSNRRTGCRDRERGVNGREGV